ncbi:MAG: methyl-accepting chemotaxis protein, partial [Rhodoferax sp.]
VGLIHTLWSAYRATALDAEEARLADAFARAGAAFVQQGLQPALAALRANDWAETSRVSVEVVSPLYRSLQDAMKPLLRLQTERAKKEFEQASSDYAALRAVVVAGIGLALLFAAGFGVLLIRSISTGLGRAITLAKAVADGDLSQRIAPQGSDELAQLTMALGLMRESLAQVVSSVRRGSEGVATASAEIAQGNNDLSMRTENQASALEETASSMDQLSATVRQNADSAHSANQVVLQASQVAARGGAVVAQVVDTMRGINESSHRIADIIQVIDGIAFQTNLLALNAAVEAARAGEQGRGFAVVASEVRSLAGRSAAAAREIKALIGTSVERVDHGSALVDQAGATMQEVVGSIERVTEIVGAISVASSQQATGVSQVGEAVSRMDQATQQNAALVEQMAAAAANLRGQAQELVQTVAVFRLT